MARRRTDPQALWRNITQAGGVAAYVEQQLREQGFYVERRATDGMSKRELERYKKELKEEAAERKRVKREAWLAYKATHVVHLGEGVFWHDELDEDRWDVPNAEARAAENDLPPLDSPKQLAEALGITVPELRWLAYHRDAATMVHYYRFTIAKRGGGERAIWAPHKKLKAAQRWILRHIAEKLPVHGAVHGFLAGRSTLSNAAVHQGSSIVLKQDLKNFFPTVTFPRVKGVFRRAGYREPIAILLALLCTEAPREVVEFDGKTYYVSLGPRCLPQGAPTSPAITNTLCLRLDRRLAGLAAKLGWRYSRYADDLTFSLPADHQGDDRLAAMMGTVKKVAAEEGFQVHPEKTRVLRRAGRQQVTGLVVNGDAPPRTPRSLRRQVRAAVHNLSRGKPLQDGETPETLRGYIAYIGMTDPVLAQTLGEELDAATAATEAVTRPS